MKKIIFTGVIAALLVSCQSFLETNPDSSLKVNIDSEAQIADLLTAAYPTANYAAFLETRTDNVGERAKGKHTKLNEAMYFWEDYDQEDLDTPLNYWNNCYAGIAQVNKALELLAPYPKTERIKALYGEAFLLRAYLHFMLVNIWAEPYAPEKSLSAPGIPYLTKPEKHAIVHYSRGTVKEVYDKIERDLRFGLSLVDDKYYKNSKFHFNKKAAHAFATRFYLMKGEWATVVEYADYVLGNEPQKVLRNWQKLTDGNHLINLARIYASDTEPANLLLTTTESRMARQMPMERYGTTLGTINQIFDNKGIDGCSEVKKLKMRTSFPFLYAQHDIKDAVYMAKFDEFSLSGDMGTKPRDLFVTNILFTTDEVMLNRMEAYAMLSQYDKAVQDLQDYMLAKFSMDLPCDRSAYQWTSSKNYTVYTPFYGMTLKQLALVKIITDFRQKEFLHEGLRWFDIRRFYLSVKRSSKSPYYRPLEKEDPRKLLQIPIQAIKAGLEPNPRYDVNQQFYGN
ncbi:RagB/SusD family nutrient uptake outer membrane protein [Alloprevotella sp. OH1205_COT-284]|uniref:RagB/SusD family nutrient uptake outer membrane protein n=1 Tax=Alloprevotella sp. OH1205_COT-284 TaxID=2491043 RepID=UPI000F5F1FF2|nr:RagB/SusD family nutrient uptake outer membrane protein [Alloprevotella sp. OH1205_COT-284]RRD80112.1 RagB/SusD family nutrient uptake outer membrane protein [Alloprevotella sp. OH1205_COT-284]